MKTRLPLWGFLALAGILAACNNGSTTVVPAPTLAPPAAPTPYGQGNQYARKGTLNSQATFLYPSPTPYPSTNVTAKVSLETTVTGAHNPFGPDTAGDFSTKETDRYPLYSRNYTDDAWIGLSSTSRPAHLVEYGYTSVDDSNDTIRAQYTAPYMLDRVPQLVGLKFSNPAGETIDESDADGTKSHRVYADNGTYTETTTQKGTNVQATVTVNADGSGSYVTNGTLLGGAFDSLIFSKPANGQITVTANFVQPPSPQPTVAPRIYTAPAWFKKPLLYASRSSVLGGVNFPAACKVPSRFGTQGNEIVTFTRRLDPVFGYIESDVQGTFTTPSAGTVCTMLADTIDFYYDYQDDFATATAAHLHFPGTPLSHTILTSAIALQHESVPLTPIAATEQMHAAVAAFNIRLERLRHQRELQVLHALTAAPKETHR